MMDIAIETTAKGFAGWLEEREQRRTGQNLPEARRSLAARIKDLSPGTFESLARNRIKKGLGDLRATLLRVVIDELEQEVRRNQHELEILRQLQSRGSSFDREQMGEVLSSLAKSQAILRDAREGDVR